MGGKRGDIGPKALLAEDNMGGKDFPSDPARDTPWNPGAQDDSARWVGDTTIRETPGVCGGYPAVGMTRIAVRSIVVIYRDAGSNLEETVAAFPQLTREQVRAALAYYQARPARVDEDITRNARALAEIKGERWLASE